MPRMVRAIALAVGTATLTTGLFSAALGQRSRDNATAPSPTGPHVTMAELHRHGGVPVGWRFTLPPGDAHAGKEVFARLECYSCHAAGTDFPAPTADPAHAGPDLTGMGAHHPAEYLAESVIAPNAVIVDGPGYTGPDGRSRMPDFMDSMSVADLVNVVAYLKSLGIEATGAHDHMAMDMDDAREQTVDGLRLRIEYDDPDEQGLAIGRLKIRVADARNGQAVPYLPLQATIERGHGKPLVVRPTPILDDTGFYYGAAVTVPDDTERLIIRIAPSPLRARGSAPRLDRTRTVTIAWTG